MATKVRNRSVGILILSLGPTIFSRTGSAAAALAPWRRRVLRMRCPFARPPSVGLGHSTHSQPVSYICDPGGKRVMKFHACPGRSAAPFGGALHCRPRTVPDSGAWNGPGLHVEGAAGTRNAFSKLAAQI